MSKRARHFTKEDIQIINKHAEKGLHIFILEKIKLKLHIFLIRVVKRLTIPMLVMI